jgi:hypothetical protein
MRMFGILRYDLERILILVSDERDERIDLCRFKEDFSDRRHPVFMEYEKGYKNADFAIEKVLFDTAKTGDMKAIEGLEEYRAKRQYELHVKEMFDV